MNDADGKALSRALDGRYEVLEVLGRGAMGTVFRARDPKLDREVALKTVHVGHDRIRLERFKREAELTAGLEHPGILKVHSGGVAGGIPYLVTELVSGGKTLVDAFPQLSVRERVSLVRDAAAALGFAHAAGVVHRDVKPANVLVDAKGKVRVADFGLAASDSVTRLTKSGAAVGTPAYMAPEQIRGSREETGPTADVWGLGVVLFEALAGKVPYMAGSYLELSRQICEDPLPPLVAEGVDESLLGVVGCAMAKHPDDRYPTGTELAADLEAWLGGTPTSASTSRPARRASGQARPWWMAVPVVALAVLAVVIVSGGEAPVDEGLATSLAPTVSQTAGPRRDAAWVAEGERRWRAIERQKRAEKRLHDIEGWLERFAGHPLESKLRAQFEDLRTRVPLTELTHASSGQARAIYYEDGLLSWGADGTVARWSGGGELTRRWILGVPLHALVVTPDGWVVTAGESSELIAFRLEDEAAPTRMTWQADAIGLCLAVHPDGRSVVIGGNSPRAVRFAIGPNGVGEREREYDGHTESVHAVAFSPDGDRLVTCSGSRVTGADTRPNQIRIYRTDSAELHRSRNTVWVGQSITFLPDHLFALGDSAGQLYLCDLEGEQLLRFEGGEVSPFVGDGMAAGRFAHSGGVRGVVRSGDGERLYSVSGMLDRRDSNELRSWDVEEVKELRAVRGRPYPYVSLDLSPDGRRLVAGTANGGLEVWALE